MRKHRPPPASKPTPPESPRKPPEEPVAWEAIGSDLYLPRRIRGSWVGGALG